MGAKPNTFALHSARSCCNAFNPGTPKRQVLGMRGQCPKQKHNHNSSCTSAYNKRLPSCVALLCVSPLRLFPNDHLNPRNRTTTQVLKQTCYCGLILFLFLFFDPVEIPSDTAVKLVMWCSLLGLSFSTKTTGVLQTQDSGQRKRDRRTGGA